MSEDGLWVTLPDRGAVIQIDAAVVKPTRLMKLSGFVQHLQWSPDGKKFPFTRGNFGGKMGLWTVHIDGTELTSLLLHQPDLISRYFSPPDRP